MRKNFEKSLTISDFSKYLFFVQSFKNPIFSLGAEKFLVIWYLSDIFKEINSKIRISFLEKLIKFSQANTKLFNRDIVLIQDVLIAIFILKNVDSSFRSSICINRKSGLKIKNRNFKNFKKYKMKKDNFLEIFKTISRNNPY